MEKRIERGHEKERKKTFHWNGGEMREANRLCQFGKKGAMNRCPNKFDVEKYLKDPGSEKMRERKGDMKGRFAERKN